MTTTIFVDDDAKKRMATWYETFRSRLSCAVESRFVETPYGRTHVLVTGPEDAPPMLSFHGALASSAQFLPELGSLVQHYRVHAVDVIGQSVMSADTRLDVRDDSYGTWGASVCAGLGLRDPIVFGVSWGGFVALRTTKVAPELARALVLVVPAGLVTGPAWRGFTTMGLPLLTYRLAPSEKRLQRLAENLFTRPDPRWTEWFGDAVRSYRMDMRIPPLAKPADLQAFAARRRPVLVLGADDDVSFPGRALVARAKELFPHVEVGVFEGCKHCPPFDDAFREDLAGRVHRFLARTLDRV